MLRCKICKVQIPEEDWLKVKKSLLVKTSKSISRKRLTKKFSMQRRKLLIMMTNLFQRMNLKRRRKKW